MGKLEKVFAHMMLRMGDANSAFIAEVPELPGCVADGKTYKDALQNVECIISEWIETSQSIGRSTPSPKGRLAFA